MSLKKTASQYRQLPRGNPLFQVGHDGGQFVFHLKHKEESLWEAVKVEPTSASLAGFIAKFPQSQYVDEARELLRAVEEEEYWNTVLNKGTLTAMVDYKTKFPNGKYIEEVRVKIKALTAEREANEVETVTVAEAPAFHESTPPIVEKAETTANAPFVSKAEGTKKKKRRLIPENPNSSKFFWIILGGMVLFVALTIAILVYNLRDKRVQPSITKPTKSTVWIGPNDKCADTFKAEKFKLNYEGPGIYLLHAVHNGDRISMQDLMICSPESRSMPKYADRFFIQEKDFERIKHYYFFDVKRKKDEIIPAGTMLKPRFTQGEKDFVTPIHARYSNAF